MITLHRNNGQQITMAQRSNLYRMTVDSERRAVGPRTFVPRSSKSAPLDWAMLAIWGCVVLSFAAFFLAGYIIWAKCHSDWPY